METHTPANQRINSTVSDDIRILAKKNHSQLLAAAKSLLQAISANAYIFGVSGVNVSHLFPALVSGLLFVLL